MRNMIAALALIAACSDPALPDEPAPDAGGPMSGTWRVAWECRSGCDAALPDPIGTVALDVSGGVLTYTGNGRSAVHPGAADDGACLNVPAADEPHRHRNAYSLCLTDAGNAEAMVVWSYVNIPTAFATWELRATR